MAKTGIANLPLHGGKAPKWLFKRMVNLSRGIIDVILLEYGREEFLKRLSDPFWFQAFSCVLGYDFHSSGTTTVTCGALKEAINPEEHGFAVAGGKGKASRKTIEQIEGLGETFNFTDSKIKELQYSSCMSAKIDNTAIQDGHSLYHHIFLFTEDGKWSVIQQGMNSKTNYARRYHWLSGFESFIVDPDNSIIGEKKENNVLNMVSKKSVSSQKTSVDLVCDHPRHLLNDWASLTRLESQTTLDDYNNSNYYSKNVICLDMPRSINWNKMREIYDFQPKHYEELLSIKGVGPNTVRALALISDLIYGDKPSWEDPVKFSFTVGGKDGVPFEVDREAMDKSTEIIKQGIQQAEIGNNERLHAFKRLKKYISSNYEIANSS